MIYVSYEKINKDSLIGVRRKIIAQCRVFEKEFGVAYYTAVVGQIIYLLTENNIIDKKFAMTKQECNEAIIQWIINYEVKQVYIRYCFSDVWFIDFLAELKQMKIKSVLEFPTIPYDGETLVSIKDRYYREQLHNYIECCTTYANFETVFGIPCITLVNGVDLEEQRAKHYREKDGTIVLLAVASQAKWHGYERVIQGMHDYYANGGERNILFNIVGDGGQVQYYKKITDEYQLHGHVLFRGYLTGTELDEIYDHSDIAIGSLGFYKTGLKSGAPIKLREYCARGIPFVYGYDDISFNKENYYAYQVINDPSPINITEVIEFYEKMYDGRNFISTMREYTLENLTWDTIMQPVIQYLS